MEITFTKHFTGTPYVDKYGLQSGLVLYNIKLKVLHDVAALHTILA